MQASFSERKGYSGIHGDFEDVFHGATYMARAENAHAFDFLLHSHNEIRLSEIMKRQSSGIQPTLKGLLKLLRAKHLDAYAVDLTTDEAMRAGLRVVRAIVPGLQPLSFRTRAQYKGHSRLYEGPGLMGYKSHNEAALNGWPQPFA